VVGKFDVNVFD